jgi:hypothetical protein
MASSLLQTHWGTRTHNVLGKSIHGEASFLFLSKRADTYMYVIEFGNTVSVGTYVLLPLPGNLKSLSVRFCLIYRLETPSERTGCMQQK